MRKKGSKPWWDQWCITPGDSLRQKIDEGLGECTHFLVLLTPQSIDKPWVNQEMDAGLVRRLEKKCSFLPVRHGLAASKLPPLLSGMHAPEISADEDMQIINDIHGISRKPPLGPAPHAEVIAGASENDYSPAANSVARLFVEKSKYGRSLDPRLDVETIAKDTSLTVADTKDALFELSQFFKSDNLHVMVKASLFTEFDGFWMPWNPKEDAIKFAADIMNDPEFPAESKTIAEDYDWEPRRLNPAATYLFDRGLIRGDKVIGQKEFEYLRIYGKEDELRRFLKSRL